MMKPRMPRKAAGAMVRALSRTSLRIRHIRIRKSVRGIGRISEVVNRRALKGCVIHLKRTGAFDWLISSFG